jgi:DNA-binding NtrC family response regulator
MSYEPSLLIVENHPSLLDLLTRNFIRQGYAVTSVGHPRQALEAATFKSFDVALLDGSLPERDGVWLMRELQVRLGHVQVIILSARAELEFESRCLAGGAFAYLRKPCGLTQIETTIAEAVAHRQSLLESNHHRPCAVAT